MHPIQSSASPEYEVQKPEWGSMGEAIEWFSTLRKAVRDVVHRAGRNIREAKDIFEELNSAHYRDYIYLDSQQQNMRNWWTAFKGQREITIEFLGQQEFLCNGFQGLARHMRTPRKSPIEYYHHMNALRGDTRAVADQADNLWGRIEEAVRCSDNFQQPIEMPSAEPLLQAKGSGFEQFQSNMFLIQKDPMAHIGHRLEVEASWEVHRAMPIDPNATTFAPILVISGNQLNAQATTLGRYLHEHFGIGEILLEALQKAWDSRDGMAIDMSTSNIQHLSVRLRGPERDTVQLCAIGSISILEEVGRAFAWFCCAVRPAPPANINLSTFTFNVESRKKEAGVDFIVYVKPTWEEAREAVSCWHQLFKQAVIVLDAPITDRTGFAADGCSLPRGLEVPFDIMVELAVINFPFEHGKGLILKGFSTLLVATASWMSSSGSAIQWHYVYSKDGTDVSDYTDDTKYHIWKRGNVPTIESVSMARAFVGWANSFDLHLDEVDREKITTTSLQNAGMKLKLQSIATSLSVGKSPVTGGISATWSQQTNLVRIDRETEFHEMIVRSTLSPILLYSPTEQRGWLLPKLPVIEVMAMMNLDRYGFPDKDPPPHLALEDTRQRLLRHLQTGLKRLVGDTDNYSMKNAFFLRELLLDISRNVEFAEAHVKPQNKASLRRLFQDTLYGLDFFKLAMNDKEHYIKRCNLNLFSWVSILQRIGVKAVLFCDGVGDVVVADSCCPTLPCGNQYVAIVLDCLKYQKDHGELRKDFFWAETPFEKNIDCSSFENHVQRAKDLGTGNEHAGGVVVLGSRYSS